MLASALGVKEGFLEEWYLITILKKEQEVVDQAKGRVEHFKKRYNVSEEPILSSLDIFVSFFEFSYVSQPILSE